MLSSRLSVSVAVDLRLPIRPRMPIYVIRQDVWLSSKAPRTRGNMTEISSFQAVSKYGI